MMSTKAIKYLKHTEIIKDAWDKCITDSINRNVYALSWYLDVVSPGWDALIIGNYEAVMPLTHRKKITFSYLAQPLFTQQLGVFYTKLDYMNMVNDFLETIPNKFKLIEINLNIFNIPALAAFQNTTLITCHLELQKPYEKLRNAYSEQIIRNIKKSQKAGLTIDINTDVKTIIELFKHNKGKALKNFNKRNYHLLITLTEVLRKQNCLYSIGAKKPDGHVIAGAIFIIFKDIAIFLFSGNNAEAKSCGAMSFVIDYFIQQHANTNLLLDFEGSNNENLARFYLSFGSTKVTYHAIHKNNLPAIINWVKRK